MKHKSAYTLVELMIVVSIIGIMVAFGTSAYTKARQKQIAEAAGEQIVSILQENQQISSIGDKDCNGKFEGQKITITNSNHIQSLSTCENGDLGVLRETSIPGIVFDTNYSFVFKPLSLGIDLGEPSSLTLRYSDPNDIFYNIKITNTGTIEYLGKE